MMLLTWYFQGHLPLSLEGAAISQLTTIAFPSLLMTLMLTSNFRRTLSLNRPAIAPTIAALLLAVVIHPVVVAFGQALQEQLPLPRRVATAAVLMLAGSSLTKCIFFLACSALIAKRSRFAASFCRACSGVTRRCGPS